MSTVKELETRVKVLEMIVDLMIKNKKIPNLLKEEIHASAKRAV